MIDHDRLLRCLSYDRLTGEFHWLVSLSRMTPVGSIAGTIDSEGYRVIRIEGRRYKAHRLAWFYVLGSWPAKQVDHINGGKADNRFSNLREASPSENQQNQYRANRDNVSGLLGACLNRKAGKWQAQIGIDGKSKFLGLYETPELAHAAYMSAKRVLHPFAGGK